MKAAYLIIGMLAISCILAACQPAPAAPTPTLTAAPTATPEPAPTATLEPSVPAAAAIGETLTSANWELTVLAIQLLGDAFYDEEVQGSVLANEGYRYLALGLKAKPLGDLKAVPFSNVMIYDENNQPYGAYYLGSQAAAGGDMDPFTIAVSRCMMMAVVGENIEIPAEAYLHLIYQVPEAGLGKELTFKFDDLAPVMFILE